MREQDDILGMGDNKYRLAADITFLMLKGMGYAAVFVLGLWLVIAVMAAIGKALPEESRETLDPTPTSSLMIMAPLDHFA